MSLTLLQIFQKGESIWFGQERVRLPKDAGWSGLMVRDEATFCVPGNPSWSTVQGRGWIPHEGAQKTRASPGQRFPYICGETEVQSCLLGNKISGKCKKLLSEPCLAHSVPLCVPCSFSILVLCHVLGHVPAQGGAGKMEIPSNPKPQCIPPSSS